MKVCLILPYPSGGHHCYAYWSGDLNSACRWPNQMQGNVRNIMYFLLYLSTSGRQLPAFTLKAYQKASSLMRMKVSLSGFEQPFLRWFVQHIKCELHPFKLKVFRDSESILRDCVMQLNVWVHWHNVTCAMQSVCHPTIDHRLPLEFS